MAQMPKREQLTGNVTAGEFKKAFNEFYDVVDELKTYGGGGGGSGSIDTSNIPTWTALASSYTVKQKTAVPAVIAETVGNTYVKKTDMETAVRNVGDKRYALKGEGGGSSSSGSAPAIDTSDFAKWNDLKSSYTLKTKTAIPTLINDAVSGVYVKSADLDSNIRTYCDRRYALKGEGGGGSGSSIDTSDFVTWTALSTPALLSNTLIPTMITDVGDKRYALKGEGGGGGGGSISDSELEEKVKAVGDKYYITERVLEARLKEVDGGGGGTNPDGTVNLKAYPTWKDLNNKGRFQSRTAVVAVVEEAIRDSVTANYVSTGWRKMPDGFIIQWGTCSSGRNVFPVEFPNACFQVIGTNTSPTRTGFQCSSGGGGYLAIGN